MSEQITVFLAQGLTRVAARPDPDERIRAVIMPFRSVLAHIASGAICDAKTIIGVLLARQHVERAA
ncbi:MAG: hypothetical protein L0Z62_17800 [Gemmataceae bacterium]|nr:hypothetical protein [Gemmataceae bacterium]